MSNDDDTLPSSDEPAAKPARRPRRKTVVEAQPPEQPQALIEPAAAAAEPAAEPPAEAAPKRRRAPRAAKAEAVVEAPAEVSADAPQVAVEPPVAVEAPAAGAPAMVADETGDAGEARPPREPSLLLQDEAATAAVQQRLLALLAEGDAPAVEEAPAAVEAESERRVLAPDPDSPKLQKVLAQSGVGSRRDIEAWIAEGKVDVNGETAHIGQRISFGDRVFLNGKPVKIRIHPGLPRVLAYHKPIGEIVTFNDPEGRPTVFRNLPKLPMGKWLSIGRLDINTEGLLLFTNNGELANQLMHPRFGVEREYAVRTLGTLEDEQKAKLLAGVEVDGQTAAFKSIESAGGEGVNRWYRVVITEGRNREVRKLFDTVGLTVSRLMRVRYGSIVLPVGLKRGVWVELAGYDVKQIRRMASPQQGQGQGQGERPERAERGERTERPERGERPERAERGERPPRGKGPRTDQPRAERPDRAERPPQRPPQEERRPRDPDAEDDDFVMPRDINPLEQTFDRRFAKNKGRGIPQGFGHGVHNDAPRSQGPKGGPREPDPMQTTMGYIGADSFHNRRGGGGGSGGGGGGGGNRSGGGGGGKRRR
jgi:23S rRNA pseudouridine2605 synthase